MFRLPFGRSQDGLFPPISELRLNEAGQRLNGPERGLARKRARSAPAETDLQAWIEANRRAKPVETAKRLPAPAGQ